MIMGHLKSLAQGPHAWKKVAAEAAEATKTQANA